MPQDRSGPLPAIGFLGGRRVRARANPSLPRRAPGQERSVGDGELGRGHHARLIAGVVILRRHDRAVVANVVEPVRLDQPQPLQVDFLVHRHGHLLGKDVVVAVAAKHQPPAVQEDVRAADFDLAHPETALHGVDRRFAPENAQTGRVERRGVRRPELDAGDRRREAQHLTIGQRRRQRRLGLRHGTAAGVGHFQSRAIRQAALAAKDRAGRTSGGGHVGLDVQLAQRRFRSRLQVHVAPDAAPCYVHVVGQVERAEHRVHLPALFGIDLDRDGDGPSGRQVIGNVRLQLRQIADLLAGVVMVDPDLGVAVYARDDQQSPPAGPVGRDGRLPLVPSFADEVMIYLVGRGAVALMVPDTRHPDLALGPSGVARPGHPRQAFAGRKPLLRLADVLRVGGEFPGSIQVDPLARTTGGRRTARGRRGLAGPRLALAESQANDHQ